MNEIDKRLALIKSEGKVGVMVHLVVGYPSLKKTESIAKTMVAAGADLIELQMPFSDPLADGPVIMDACSKSLANGTTVADFIKTVNNISKNVQVPILIMTYYNNLFRYGLERFCIDTHNAGASGLIVPDMPIDEEVHENFFSIANKHGLYPIHIIAPASTQKRLKKNAKIAKGFVYCTSSQGITGVRKKLDDGIIDYLKRVREEFKIPLAVGFGISKRKQVKSLAKYTDIVVVGSAIINIINKNPGKEEENVGRFVRDLSNV